MTRIAPRHWLIAFAAALLVLWMGRWSERIKSIENVTYDMRVSATASRFTPSDDIVLVTVDEESMARLAPAIGRWPWPREVLVYVLDFCRSARVVGMDVLLTEPDFCDDSFDGDQAFANWATSMTNLVGAVVLTDNLLGDELPPSLERFEIKGAVKTISESAFPQVVMPYDALEAAISKVGFVNFWRDPLDAKARAVKLVSRVDTHDLPSLAMATWLKGEGIDTEELKISPKGAIRYGSYRNQLDADGNLWVRWPSVEHVYPTIPIIELLEAHNAETAGGPATNELLRSAFDNKIVLVGLDAAGVLRDLERTPLHQELPGVVVHAVAIDNLLQGRSIRFLSPVWVWLLVLLFAFAPALLSFFGLYRPWQLPVCFVVLTFLLILLAYLPLWFGDLVIPMVLPFLALALSCSCIGTLNWGSERRSRRRLEELDRAKQQFTDMLVHDLKNTVAPVMMSLDLVKKGDDSPLKDGEFPYYVEQTYNQLMLQVHSLLDIRKMEEGRLQLQREPCLPHELIEDVLNQYRPPATRMKLTLKCEITDRVVLELDTMVFRRIVENLIWNAIKYASRQSTVSIFSSYEDGYTLRIRNQCRPLPADKLSMMFGAFVAGESRTSMGYITSTGLGLAFCKLAVEGHGGQIALDSPVPGEAEGFQVSIQLPSSSLSAVDARS